MTAFRCVVDDDHGGAATFSWAVGGAVLLPPLAHATRSLRACRTTLHARTFLLARTAVRTQNKCESSTESLRVFSLGRAALPCKTKYSRI